MTAKVHKEGGGDRLTIESGGVLTIESGAALRAESGAIIEIAPNWKTVAGTSFGISNYESGKTLKTTNGSAVLITVPAGLSISPIEVVQFGAGQVTFVEGGGVTIRTPETLKIAKQYAAAKLSPTDTANEYILTGDLLAA